MRQLTDVFEKKLSKKDSWDRVTPRNLHLYKLEQDVDKSSEPHMPANAAKKIFELDVLTQQAIQKSKSGLSDSLRELSIADTEHEDYWTT